MDKFKQIAKKVIERIKDRDSLPILFELWDMAKPILKDVLIELMEILEAGLQGGFVVGAAIITSFDKMTAVSGWYLTKLAVKLGRKGHELHLMIDKHKKVIVKNLAIVGAGALVMVAVFSWATDYEYSYHGRALGIVEEQRDVIELLDLASEELSKEYGTNIVIDAEEDITFRAVTSYGKEIDTQDKVLQRLTYMGEINAKACAIVADGKTLVVVEDRRIAKAVLEDIKKIFVTDSDTVEYEYIGFAEDVKLVDYSTTLKNVSGRAAAVQKLRSGGQTADDYIVQQGDTIYGICTKLGLTMDELEKMNPGLDATLIHVGDAIKVQREIPLLTIETVEVATFAEAIPFKTEYETSSYYFEGEKIVKRAGVEGKAAVVARLTKRNGEIVETEELSREVVIEPSTQIVVKGTKPTPPKTGTGSLIRPVNVAIYSDYGSRWGRMHYGIDLSTSSGTPIRAADGGTVIMSGWNGNYGYCVKIDHGNGMVTVYAHNSANYVSVGDKVYQGQTIAAVGNTGRSTGPHCHFEVLLNGRNVDPKIYV